MSSFAPFRTCSEIVLSDGGLETSLVYKAGMPMREDAAFEAFDIPKYASYMKEQITLYCRQAVDAGLSVTLDTPTYRASHAYFDKLGTPQEKRDEFVSQKSVSLLNHIRSEVARSTTDAKKPGVYFIGAVGPMGDAYNTKSAPSVEEAREYHRNQVRITAASGVDAMCCYTFTNSNEAIGVALEAAAFDIPCAVSFTLDRDGRLTCGETLGEAIAAVDSAVTGKGKVAYFGVNCIHPTALQPILKEAVVREEPWLPRLKMFRGNASAKSHEELAEGSELDEGNPQEWAQAMKELRTEFPGIQLCGGCCGTGTEHQLEMAREFTA